MNVVLFSPKGSMCMVCENKSKSCVELDFKNMPVIQVLQDGIKIVKCTSFKKPIDKSENSC